MKNLECKFLNAVSNYVNKILLEYVEITHRMEAVLAGKILDRCNTHSALV